MELLTLEHLAHYYAYNVGIVISHRTQPNYMTKLTPAYLSDPTGVKLILIPLSDYTDVNSESMNDLNCDLQYQIELSDFAKGHKSLYQWSVGVYKIMCENHIDFNRLIEKGLAINKNHL